MEIDLTKAGAEVGSPLQASVCIVGAGIAGLTLATRLAGRGVDVLLLEAGGLKQRTAAEPLTPVLHEGDVYAGLGEDRVCALGGCSLTWGGQLLPLPEDAAWPVAAADLRPYECEAEVLLVADRLPYEAQGFFAAVGAAQPEVLLGLPEFVPRVSKFLPFGRRNLARTLGEALLRHPRVRVVLGAQVRELVLSASGESMAGVLALIPGGRELRVEAKEYVLAAGTVESCRLLLASRSVMPDGVGNAHDQVGRNFHDHLTVPAATFAGAARRRLLKELRPWITYASGSGAVVHSVKLEPGASLRERLGLRPSMAHLTVEEPGDSGVAVVRDMLRARQSGVQGSGVQADAFRGLRGVVEGLRLSWEARVEGRRYVSDRAAVRLQLNAAMETPSGSRISLSEEKDRQGLRCAVLDWRVREGDLGALRRFGAHLRERLEGSGIGDGVRWEPALFEGALAVLPGLDHARHAMGGACMGRDPRQSVVDPDLRVHGVANLSVASAAVFPDGSPQLPTLTLAALALRLAERIGREVQ